MTKEQIEKMFELWWKDFVKKDLGLNVEAIPDHKTQKAFTSAINLLMPELTQLKQRLEEAEKVIFFYGDENNQIAPIYHWDGRNRPGADFTSPYRMDNGKRAREYLAKYKEKENDIHAQRIR